MLTLNLFGVDFSSHYRQELVLIVVDFTFAELKFIINLSGTPSKDLDELSFALVVLELPSEVSPVTPREGYYWRTSVYLEYFPWESSERVVEHIMGVLPSHF